MPKIACVELHELHRSSKDLNTRSHKDDYAALSRFGCRIVNPNDGLVEAISPE